MTRTSFLIAMAALGGFVTACNGKEPAKGFEAALPAPPPAPAANVDGSIFSASQGYAPLYLGNRASAVGDPLTIMLVETTKTSKSAGSQTARDGGFSLTPPSAGPLSFLNPDALKASGDSQFTGKGNASQESSLTGQLSVTIAEVRPNGTALVRGEKRLALSQGEEWVQFSGIVRLSDLDQDNRILSSRVADARIIYTGKGAVQRASREGWLSKFFNMITPF